MATNVVQCPGCHQPVPVSARTCPHCGVLLSSSAPGQPVILEPPMPPASIAPLPAQTQSSPVAPLPLNESLPDALKQIDTVASTELTISGVLVAFYAGAIFAGKVVVANLLNAIIYSLPIFLLLVTMILSLRVFYPGGYLIGDHAQLLKIKDARLRHSSLLLEISVGILAVSVLVYLLRQP